MDGPLTWFAAIGAALAAAIIAADAGRRWTGWGFVLFAGVSVAWIVTGLSSHALPIVVQNAVLLAINLFGAWQFLLNPRKKREIDRAEQIAEQAHEEVAAQGH